jgi:hypothetical protein
MSPCTISMFGSSSNRRSRVGTPVTKLSTTRTLVGRRNRSRFKRTRASSMAAPMKPAPPLSSTVRPASASSTSPAASVAATASSSRIAEGLAPARGASPIIHQTFDFQLSTFDCRSNIEDRPGCGYAVQGSHEAVAHLQHRRNPPCRPIQGLLSAHTRCGRMIPAL